MNAPSQVLDDRRARQAQPNGRIVFGALMLLSVAVSNCNLLSQTSDSALASPQTVAVGASVTITVLVPVVGDGSVTGYCDANGDQVTLVFPPQYSNAGMDTQFKGTATIDTELYDPGSYTAQCQTVNTAVIGGEKQAPTEGSASASFTVNGSSVTCSGTEGSISSVTPENGTNATTTNFTMNYTLTPGGKSTTTASGSGVTDKPGLTDCDGDEITMPGDGYPATLATSSVNPGLHGLITFNWTLTEYSYSAGTPCSDCSANPQGVEDESVKADPAQSTVTLQTSCTDADAQTAERNTVSIRLSALLATALAANPGLSQLAGIKESGVFQTDRGWQDVITNQSAIPIIALHVTLDCTESNGRRVVDTNGSTDSLFQLSHDSNIPPGGSFAAKALRHAQCSGGADAAVFSDGHTEGSKEAVAKIFDLRRGAYNALSTVIPLLDQIAAGQMSAQAVIKRIDHIQETESKNMALSMEERTGEAHVYGTTKSLLGSQLAMRTPSDSTPARQPSIDSLAEEQGITREQAHAIVTRNKFQEWRSALEGHTESSGGN